MPELKVLTVSKTIPQLTKLFSQGKRLEYLKGEFIVRPGETPIGVFYIESGLVKSYNYTRYGEENLLSLRHANQIVGLTSVLDHDSRLDVMYMALSPTVLWLLPTTTFFDSLEKDAASSLSIINLLTELYLQHSEHILNLEYRTVRERLIAFLLTLGRDFGRPKDNTIIIEAPLRHQDIASYINASRETTSREIGGLEKKGFIDSRQGLIILKEAAKLQAYLEP